MEPSTSETRDKEEGETPPSNTRGRQTTTDFDHQLDRDEEYRDIVPPIRYGFVVHIFYALNADERLKNLETKAFKKAFESNESLK